MNVLEVEGKTIDDATKKALAELGIKDTSKVKIEVIDEGKSGIFGFGVSRQAKIFASACPYVSWKCIARLAIGTWPATARSSCRAFSGVPTPMVSPSEIS